MIFIFVDNMELMDLSLGMGKRKGDFCFLLERRGHISAVFFSILAFQFLCSGPLAAHLGWKGMCRRRAPFHLQSPWLISVAVVEIL